MLSERLRQTHTKNNSIKMRIYHLKEASFKKSGLFQAKPEMCFSYSSLSVTELHSKLNV